MPGLVVHSLSISPLGQGKVNLRELSQADLHSKFCTNQAYRDPTSKEKQTNKTFINRP